MKEYYSKSRIIMLVLAVVISLIMFINEHISFKIYGTFFIAIVTLVVSFLFTPISKKIIERGDRIEKKLLRIIYYVFGLPILLVMLFLVACVGITFLFNNKLESTKEFGALLGIGILMFYLFIASGVALMVPYIQSLIVLFLRNKDKNDKK